MKTRFMKTEKYDCFQFRWKPLNLGIFGADQYYSGLKFKKKCYPGKRILICIANENVG